MGIESESVQNDSRLTARVVVIDIVKYTVHGFLMTAAFVGLDYYMEVLLVNSFFGNRIFFLPLLLMLCVPLVFILLGALNRALTEQLWNYKASNNWASLLVQGVIISFITMYAMGIFENLLMAFFHVFPYGFIGVFFLLPYTLIIIPFFGLICKVVLATLMDIAKAIG
ncbi:MAG: hypothetical protein ACFFEL_15280 [Candidatus Thorarchaeota archaeon]